MDSSSSSSRPQLPLRHSPPRSLASRLSTPSAPPSQPPLVMSSSQSPVLLSPSPLPPLAFPYPSKTNLDAIRARFGLHPSTSPRPRSGSLPRSALDGRCAPLASSAGPCPPTASSLMHNSVSAHSSPPRRPRSVIEPALIPLSGLSSHPFAPHSSCVSPSLQPLPEHATLQNRFSIRCSHPCHPSHLEPHQLVPAAHLGDVAGMQGRLRLSKDLVRSPVATSTWVGGLNLLESQRHLLQAYEYLCHVGEAKEWLQAVLIIQSIGNLVPSGPPLAPQPPNSSLNPQDLLHHLSVTEFEQALRDGVILARLARRFMGLEGVPRIFIHPKLQYRHSDNINYFFRFVRSVGLPELFIFELVDLYNAKNLPKVIYCIHVLSHLLANRGMVERIGNLVGKLEFSNDQLEQTTAGLAGKPMPNFGNINNELAKEIKEEPELEVESEADRIVRELTDLLPNVIGMQSQLRGVLARLAYDNVLISLQANLDSVFAFQAVVRGYLQRRRCHQLYNALATNRSSIVSFQAVVRRVRCVRKCRAALRLRRELEIWAVALQAAARSWLARRRVQKFKSTMNKLDFFWTALQAHARGTVVRRRRQHVVASAQQFETAFVALQSLVRARLMTQTVQERKKQLETVEVAESVVQVQAHIRGILARRRFFEPIQRLDAYEGAMVQFQSLIRTRLVRSRLSSLVTQLMDTEHQATAFQAACRGALARSGLLKVVQDLQAVERIFVDLQAVCRGALVHRSHAQKAKALNRVEVTRGVGGLQAFVRAGLIRKKIVNQKKELDFIQPDVVGIQAQCRGALARREWVGWFEHVRSSEPVAVFLQSLTRGFLLRRQFFERLLHYHDNLDKVVKVQSVYRARQQASQYKQLTRQTNVPISTIKTFLHLLDDSDVDYEEEIELSKLRTEVVRLIRDNQLLDVHVNDLDTKIALLVKNKITLDDVQRVSGGGNGRRRKDGVYRNSVLAAANDPFATSNLLDKTSKRKLELYQQFFYLLQTRPEYLARLFYVIRVSGHDEKVKRVLEGVVLTLFGYAQMRREEFLLLKLFQRSIHEELAGVSSLSDFVMGDFAFVRLMVQYGRGTKERRYLKDILTPVICDVVAEDSGYNLETDPIRIYRSVINEEETRTGIQSSRPLNVTFHEALADQETLALFIKHLQSLRGITDRFLYAITQSPKKVPFGLRYIAREIFRGLQVKFVNESEDALAKVVLHMIYYRYLQPAVVAPEAYDVVDSVLNPLVRKNLSEASKMLNQIAVGRLFSDEIPYLVPLNEYVTNASNTFTTWFYSLVDVEDAELHFAVDEYLDHTVSTKPTIYISPNEIYSTHSLVLRDLDQIAPGAADPLRMVLLELGGAPSAASAELDQARAGEIALHLENKLAVAQDPEADLKALWVKTKRYVLAMLKVQPGLSLLEAFLAPVTEEHEDDWSRIVVEEMESEKHRKQAARAIGFVPAATSSSDHFPGSQALEDVHLLSFQELKARTLENVLALEKRGRLSRDDCYQGILDSLAKDILQRNRRRIQRRGDMSMLVNTLGNLNDKRRYLEEQEAKYHSYIADSMAAMQKKGTKKKFVMPFTPQWHHLRSLEKEGRKPQFGSYKYSAQRLYEKGILLSIHQISPKQFDKLSLIISCDEVGVFKIETQYMDSALVPPPPPNTITDPTTTTSAANTTITANHKNRRPSVGGGCVELRMEDLLEDQFDGKQSVNLEIAKLNLNLLLYLINRKFYV